MHKWTRMLNNINSKYDADGDFEENYRNVKRKINQMTRNDEREADDEEEKEIEKNS